MSGLAFFDANIPICADDVSAPEKRERAKLSSFGLATGKIVESPKNQTGEEEGRGCG
jgi:hypothetical protein